ncbi:uncharacterized protein [Macrobrachium rosenbergii]|uniref:uncharacterized protein n=1 Tax=Macrobrachium rosenbergii TaxID=79674 RepID=UPI0034D4037A
MGTTGLLCIVLLAAGASNAFPQYAGQPQQEQDEPQQQQQQEPEPVVTQLTEDQKEGLANFWWQNQGVFDSQNPGGTVVVVQEQSSQPETQGPEDFADAFIPSPSPDCAPREGCIPWQYCVDGVFTNTGEGLLSLRTPTKVPETYTQKLCGQIGNLCCRIPDELLAAQQQGQSSNAGPYGAGGEGIIEVTSTGGATGGVAPVQEQTGSAAGAPAPVQEQTGGAAGAPAPVQEQTGSAADALAPVQEQTGGAAGFPAPVQEQTGGAVVGSHATSGPGPHVAGDGQIAEVVGPAVDSTVQVADQTGVPSTSTVVQTSGGGAYGPGNTGDLTEVVTVVKDTECPAHTHDCVPHFQCIDGEINTSGAGLIDPRIPPKRECTSPDFPEVPGKCCRIPGATPPPAPKPVQTCPGKAECVSKDLCKHAGVGQLNPRSDLACYLDYVDDTDFTAGVCCEPPAPAHLETCPGSQQCVAKGACAAHGAAGYDASKILTCHIPGGSLTGECCDPPPVPAGPTPLTKCPDTQECVENHLCSADGTINTDGAGLINVRVYHKPCYLDAATSTTGVCCQPPTPPAPTPLKTCPGTQVCVSEARCASAAASGAAATSYVACISPDATTGTGVCCDSPIPIVEVCPDDSVCIPETLCQGEILNAKEEYIPFGTTGVWTQCPLSGDLSTPGVCCRNPAKQTDPSDYTAAGQCGVRNAALDLRSSPLLQKNEAHFGEFPWQAIVFFTNFTFKCGASIIDDRWLLTAAHCVDGYKHGDFKVRLGEWQVDKYDEPLKYQDVNIISITVHPDFKSASLHNDIALIELETPLVFQYHINSVCLPSVNQIPESGTRCIASGWGKDAFTGNYQAILKKVDVPFVARDYCQQLLRKTRLGKYFVLDKSFMCAGGEENKDACEGDGGGPLVCEDPATGRYYVAGITAWGIDCGVKDVPGVYVNVQLFRPWIDGIIAQTEQQQQGSSGYGR